MNGSRLPFWPEVGVKGIPTNEFLCSCDVIVQCLAGMGTTLSPAKSDVEGNINKLRTVYSTNPVKYEFLLDMIRCEKNIKDSIAPDALLWLKRVLHFLYLLLDGVVKDVFKSTKEPEITSNYHYAYSRTLREHHNIIMSTFCIVVINTGFMPDCRPLLLSCCRNAPDGTSTRDLATRLKPSIESLRSNLSAIIAFYHAEGLDAVATI